MSPDLLERRIHSIGIDTATLQSEDGAVALYCTPGARLIGLWPDPALPNLLWTNPNIPGDPQGAGGWYDFETGGMGGDRLWFGPEHRWFWEGIPMEDLGNWRVPWFMDPGNYKLRSLSKKIRLTQRVLLGEDTFAHITKQSQIIPGSGSLPGDIKSISIQDTHDLRLENPTQDLEIDLWNIMQIPFGTWLIVPTLERPEIGISYESIPGEIKRRICIEKDHLRWHVTGQGNIKGSLPVTVIKGMVATLQNLGDDKYALTVRRFSPVLKGSYRDALFPDQVDEQCVQWWDGLGYGEIEVHSPTLSKNDTEISEKQYLHAYIGSPDSIQQVTSKWLECDLPDNLFQAG